MDNNERFVRYWTEAHAVVSAFINSLVHDHAAAEDVVQNVVVVLMRRFPEYDESRPFVAWAIGVAKKQVQALHRDSGRSFLTFEAEIMDQVASAYVEIYPELEPRAAALQKCLQSIKGRARQVIELRYFEDFKPREIALRLSMTAGAVRVLLVRLRTVLRECVERNGVEGIV